MLRGKRMASFNVLKLGPSEYETKHHGRQQSVSNYVYVRNTSLFFFRAISLISFRRVMAALLAR